MAERALAASELRYRRLFESARDGILILDAETGIVVDVNPFLLNLLDYPIEEFVGKAIWELGFFKDIVGNRDNFIELQQKEYIRYEDKPLEDSSGRQHEVEFISNVYLANNQKVIQCNIRDNTEHKRTKDQIKRLARFPSENPNPVLRISAQGILEYANPAADLILSVLGAEKTGDTINAEWQAHIEKSIAKAHPIDFESQAKGHTFEVTAAPVIEHGYVNLYARDITNQKKAEETLRDKTRLLSESQRLGHVGSWMVEADGQVVFSDEMYRMLGVDPDTFGTTLDSFIAVIHPDDQHLMRFWAKSCAAGEHPAELEFRIIWPDGTVRIILGRGELALDERTQTTHMAGSGQDITEHKQADEALRTSQQITEGIIDAIPVRVFWKDKNLVFLGCNAAFARDAGFSDPKNVIGKDDYQMGWRDQAEQYRADDRQTIESGCSISNREELQTTPEGTVITLLTSKIPLRNGQGEISGVIGTYMDITQQRQMEVQLRQTQKMEAIGQLVGGVAHDFNNMLQIILGHAEIVINKTAPDNPITGSLQEIQEAARRSAALTRQLLAFARKQDIAPEILNLNDAVAGMLKMIQRLIGEDINLVWRPGTDLRPVKLDPSQIDQILANLCLNARDAIVGVGTITLETGNVTIDEAYCAGHAEAVPGEYVFLAVSDNGCGMDRKTLAHIFEPFFTTKDVGKGTGLGLATVYGIIKQNNGFIYTYSEPDQGTTFRIYLPQAEAEVKTPAENRAETPAGREETILLAEDDPSLRALCTLFLKDLGYNVLTTETSKEALALAEQHPGDIQLLLTDVVMPEMNGRQLSEKVLAVKPDMRVLFMSGYTADMIAQRGVLDQNVAFLAKPFTRNELARKVRDVLNT